MKLRQSGRAGNRLIVLRVVSLSLVLASCSSMQPSPSKFTPSVMDIIPGKDVALDSVFDSVVDQDLLEEVAIPLPRMKPPMPRRLIPRAALAKDRFSARKPPLPKPKPVRPIPVTELPLDPVAPDTLVGSDYSSVLRVLRQPDAVESKTLPVIWTYSESDCTLQLFFYPDIRTTKFHMMKYDLKDSTGEKLNHRDSCMRDIER